jgi:hypothetical protein
MTLSGAISVFLNEVVEYQGIAFAVRRRFATDRGRK